MSQYEFASDFTETSYLPPNPSAPSVRTGGTSLYTRGACVRNRHRGVPYSISRIFALGTAPMDLFTTWPFLNTNRVGMLDTP